MAELRQWFTDNQFLLFAIYGQVFFTLGVALAVQSLKRSRLGLGRHLHWLALFGLMHGLVEWGYVLIPLQEASLGHLVAETLRWLQIAMMVASFVCLLQFGLRTAIQSGPLQRPAGTWTVAAVLVTLSVALGSVHEAGADPIRTGIEIWSRYLMAVTGSAASGVGVIRGAKEAREMGVLRISGWLRISSWSLLAYALLNVVTPAHHDLLAYWVNYGTWMQRLVVPAQVWRAILGAGLLYGMIRSLSLFEVETDRLLKEAREQKLLESERELTCMNRIAIALSSARDPVLAMQAVLEEVLAFLRCTGGWFAVRGEGWEGWRQVARAGKSPPHCDFGRPDIVPLVSEVATTLRPVFNWEAGAGWFCLALPVQWMDKQTSVMVLYHPDPFDLAPQEMQLIESLGVLIGVSLENGRLWAELQQREADRTVWFNRVLTAQEDERRRIAHELHDDTVQSMVLLCRRLDGIEDAGPPLAPETRDGLEQARRDVLEMIASMRNFAHALRPPALDELGLMAGLNRLLADVETRAAVRCSLEVTGSVRRLARDVEAGLYRIAQEALRNVERHARARSVRVGIDFGPTSVSLQVTDDGRGLPPGVAEGGTAATDRLGMMGMHERATFLGGTLQVTSSPGSGTTIAVTVPCSGESLQSHELASRISAGF